MNKPLAALVERLSTNGSQPNQTKRAAAVGGLRPISPSTSFLPTPPFTSSFCAHSLALANALHFAFYIPLSAIQRKEFLISILASDL